MSVLRRCTELSYGSTAGGLGGRSSRKLQALLEAMRDEDEVSASTRRCAGCSSGRLHQLLVLVLGS